MMTISAVWALNVIPARYRESRAFEPVEFLERRIRRLPRPQREALEVRRAAQAQMTEAAAMTAVVGPLLRSLGLRKIYAVALAALMARFFGGAARH